MSEFLLAYPALAAMVVVAGAWAVMETASTMKLRPVRVRARPRR